MHAKSCVVAKAMELRGAGIEALRELQMSLGLAMFRAGARPVMR